MASFPNIYAVVPHGDCMEPLYHDGKPLIVSSVARCEPGDVVIVHLRPEFVQPGGYEAVVKRLKYPLYGATFPWSAEGSDVVIPLTVEQLNPPSTINIPYTHILAVHKVLGQGVASADGRISAPATMLEAA